jgi:cephalosporin hydroxylase
MPEDALIAVAGDLPESGETGRRYVHFEPAPGAQSLDSAGAIVELERSRTRGAGFLMLPAPTNAWLDELALFGDHCRSRYDLIFESTALGAVLDLRRRGAAATESHSEAEAASVEGGTAEAEEGPDALDALARSLSQLVRRDGFTANEFRTFERHGVHVTPVHFYGPIPDTAQLSDEVWAPSELVGIDMNDDEQLHLLREVFPQFRGEYEALPTAPTDDHTAFHLENGLFGGTDALVLYCMLRHLRPRRVIEVGSGPSTRLSAQAARSNGSTELVCIEPYPDEVLQEGFEGLTSLITARVEEVSLDLFTALEADDVLFIDSSHVVRIGGDVAFLFLEVLPRLRPGVVVQVHDVFLPHQYPHEWVVDGLRFWNEQYLLQAFLASNSAFRVVLANSYLEARYPDVLRSTFPTSPWWGGGSFWFQRRPDSPMQSEESPNTVAEPRDRPHAAPTAAVKIRRSPQPEASESIRALTLREIGARTGTDKAEPRRTILDLYDQHLRTLRNEPITLLEIGVFRGESLRMWRDYFPLGRIYGVDIEPDSMQHEDERIRVFIGSQSDVAFLENVVAESGNPDIIVDDGSHLASDQIGSLLHLWPHLKPGGYYIVEDTHTSYLSNYRMGFRQPGTTIELLKKVIDDVHVMWHDGEVTLPQCEWVFFASETCLIRKLAS